MKKRIEQIDKSLRVLKDKIKKKLTEIQYVDPASADPPVQPTLEETVWFEDGFPAGAKRQSSGGELDLVTSDTGEVFKGERALRLANTGFSQDFYQKGAQPLIVPAAGKVFAYCYLDPEHPPETIMLQFHTNGWKHRAVWGDESKIDFGKPGTAEKVLMGELPETGKWVRLVVNAKQMGLTSGKKVTGFAFTQFGGTVTWDHLGISAIVDRRKDITWSWKQWKKQKAGKRNNELPEGLRQLVRAKQPDQWSEQETKRIHDHWLEHTYAGAQDLLADLKSEQSRLQTEKDAIAKDTPLTFVMADLPKPRKSFVMKRGAYDQPGEPVSRNVPSFLPGLPQLDEKRDYNRLDFANWLLSPEHPLTARVAVNRFWQQFFGTGLVRTSGDFGSQGEPPSHPELLDWLASEFVQSGWDVRRLVKLIVTSHTYQQSSRHTPPLLAQDPDNRLLGRAPRLRLDAEVLRDQALFVSGMLVGKIGGKPVKPYQPPNIWEPVGFGNSNTRYYKQDSGDALYRRSLYTFLKRTAPPPFMASFDAPNREQSCTRRARSNTPMQALQLMNDVQHVEAARQFATRIIKQDKLNQEEKLDWALEVVLARPCTEHEKPVLIETLHQFLARYSADVESAKQLIEFGESKVDASIDPALLASWTMIANTIMNLDESVTKN